MQKNIHQMFHSFSNDNQNVTPEKKNIKIVAYIKANRLLKKRAMNMNKNQFHMTHFNGDRVK